MMTKLFAYNQFRIWWKWNNRRFGYWRDDTVLRCYFAVGPIIFAWASGLPKQPST